MERLDVLVDVEDIRLMELRARVQAVKPHVPEPGDADYQDAESIAYCREARHASASDC